jgi:hypothetical protein
MRAPGKACSGGCAAAAAAAAAAARPPLPLLSAAATAACAAARSWIAASASASVAGAGSERLVASGMEGSCALAASKTSRPTASTSDRLRGAAVASGGACMAAPLLLLMPRRPALVLIGPVRVLRRVTWHVHEKSA